MPNWCGYTMKAVSKSKEALDRLINIMSYMDKEYYIYRCASVDVSNRFQEDDYFVVMLYGDVIWNECVGWHQTWFDEEGNDLPEPIESGGFDYYCDFDTASAIYNAV